MNVTIDILDQLQLDFAFRKSKANEWKFNGLFAVFKYRNGRPHLSLFANPNRNGLYTPHFTAMGGRNGEFRRTLARVDPASLESSGKRMSQEFLRHYLAGIERVDIEFMDQAGWTVHCAQSNAVRRWIRRVIRSQSELRIHEAQIVALAGHVLRHGYSPTELHHIPPGTDIRLLAIRSNEGDDCFEIRPLWHFPNGIDLPEAFGGSKVPMPPGWYWHDVRTVALDTLENAFPRQWLEKQLATVSDLLKQFPRLHTPAEGEDLPPWAGLIFGYFADGLFAIAIEEALASANRTAPRD